MNQAWWEGMPKCTECAYPLCFLDRLWDDCPMCGEPIPDNLLLEEVKSEE